MRKFIDEHEFIFIAAILYLAITFFFRIGFAIKHTTSIPGNTYSGKVLAVK